MGLKIPGLFSSLFPALKARQDAKRYNRLVDIADAAENSKRAISNEEAGHQAAFEAWKTNITSGRIARNFGRNFGNLQADYASHNTQELIKDLSTRMSESQALGAAYAEQALNGTANTALAHQINNTTKAAIALRRSGVDQEKADDLRQYQASARELVSSAFDSLPTDIYAANLDRSYSKSAHQKVGGVWAAAINDVGRLVATYYGGTMATQAIDQVNGYAQRSAANMQGIQNAYDRIYGGGRRASFSTGPDLTGLVGAAGSFYSGGQGAFTKGGNFKWASGIQYGAFGARSSGYQNFWSNFR